MSQHGLEETVLHGDFIGHHIVGEGDLVTEELADVEYETVIAARPHGLDGSAAGAYELEVVRAPVESMRVMVQPLPCRGAPKRVLPRFVHWREAIVVEFVDDAMHTLSLIHI